MFLKHILKSSQHLIPVDADRALQNSSFAVYREEKSGTVKHVGIGWRFFSTQKPQEGEKKAKYQEHAFELLIGPEHIDKAIEALQWAKRQMGA